MTPALLLGCHRWPGLLRAALACIVAALLALAPPGLWAQAAAGRPMVGVLYFPGWKNDAIGATSAKPWAPITAYPEREPLLGWYDEGSGRDGPTPQMDGRRRPGRRGV